LTSIRFIVGLASLVLLAWVGCAPGPTEVPNDPSYASDVQPILTDYCISCHAGSSPSGGYALTSRAAALGAGSDTVPNVIPGNADSSKLYRRIMGVETPTMPPGGTTLDTARTATIRNWVNRGAKDN